MVAAVPDIHYAPLATDPLLRLLRHANGVSVAPPGRDRGFRDELAAIAAKLGRRIVVPERPFTEDEAQTVALLREILHTGRVTRTWDSLEFALPAAAARDVLGDFAGQNVNSLGLEGAAGETVELFGTPLPLGPTRLYIPQARLANEREVHAALVAHPPQDGSVDLRFVPGEDRSVVTVYLDWALAPAPGPLPLAIGLASPSLDAAERPAVLAPEQGRRLAELFERQAAGALTDDERRELESLVDEYGRLLHERQLGLFALRHGCTTEQARHEVEAGFDRARAWWAAFEAEPSHRRALTTRARRRGIQAVE